MLLGQLEVLESQLFVVISGRSPWNLPWAQAAAPPPSGVLQTLFSPVGMIAVLFVLFYVMVLLPEKRNRKQLADQLAALKKNDRVVTVGGIHGTVVSISDDDCVVIRVDENNNTRLQVSRSAISRIVNNDAEPKH